MPTHTKKHESDDYYESRPSGIRIQDTQRTVWFGEHFARHDTLTIGRTRQRHFQIDDKTVSRFHCEILRRRGPTYVLVDRRSKNGLHVARFGPNSRPVRVKKINLEVGMHIDIGDETLLVIDQKGRCPILCMRYTDFLCSAASVYGTPASAARHIGRSAHSIRRALGKRQEQTS